MEKAYKLLALQEGISNRAAKDLIDRGVVYAAGKKVSVARGELSPSTKFKIEKIAPIKTVMATNGETITTATFLTNFLPSSLLKKDRANFISFVFITV